MRTLLYQDLNTRRVKPAFVKVLAALQAGDFRSCDVKKLNPTPYWRAKLDYSNRLLLQFARFGGETVCLVLEVIENHAYDKSRFLRGAVLDEAKIEREPLLADATDLALNTDKTLQNLRWLHPSRDQFELLDKPLMFDDMQEAVRRLPAPVVVVGSAGSGKTAVTLTKLREAEGRVLYVTHSAYLAQSARALYAAHAYENPAQEVEFLSYREFIETLHVPAGREVTFAAFAGWFERHRQTVRAALGDMDAHAVFEEFRGVIGAAATGPLDFPNYLALGPRQSLLAPGARQAAFTLFGRYQQWLDDSGQFDLNLIAHGWLAYARPVYDFMVIDEVQDLTPVQLALLLVCLQKPGQFLLCGDSNQIVHPNFFSWAAIRTLFWHGLAGDAAQRQALSVLQANFRNTRAVTRLANTLLQIKQARFGSIDRESNFLVKSASIEEGEVRLLPAKDAVLRELDARTKASVNHAVVVLRDEDKAEARSKFHTPLVFSVHEAKGLEYPHVILYSLVSGQRAAFSEVCQGVTAADLGGHELDYSRAKDKGDKSLELYKFYVNALYVALTRAVQSLVLVESDTSHPLLQLLGLEVSTAAGTAQANAVSTKEEWAQEARKLELQGKQEQAQAIRDTFLQHKPVPWTPWSEAVMRELLPRALDKNSTSTKPRQALLDYGLWHGQQAWVEELVKKAAFPPARVLSADGTFGGPPPGQYNFQDHRNLALKAVVNLRQRHLQASGARNFKDLLRQCDLYGVDHRTFTGATTLMLAARAGNLPLIEALLARGADPLVEDEFGHTAWLVALNRATEEPEFTRQHIAPMFERIAPAALDVQTGGRLLRLERHQAEYWALSLMLAGFKTLYSDCWVHRHPPYKYHRGFFADYLLDTLQYLPDYLWSPQRRKRSYINHVLARAELESSYQPARQLWVRVTNGHYLPNPALQLRASNTTDTGTAWRPVYDALNLSWLHLGTLHDTYNTERSPQRLVEYMAKRIADGSVGDTSE
ncbi:MAG: AAA family ATPase [Polaromonas sp.]|nr:AAA family ATPase [Polaromonas sp.]